MATNGQPSDHEALAALERAITGAASSPVRRDATMNDDSITTFNEEHAERYRALGRHALEHGQYISQACNEYADKLLSDHRKLSSTVLQAERKLVADAESFIGSK